MKKLLTKLGKKTLIAILALIVLGPPLIYPTVQGDNNG